MEYIKTVQLDLAPEEHFQYVHVKQGDSLLRKLEITITNDGQTYRPSGVDHVWFREQKPDGHGVILESNGSDPHVEIQNAEENVKYVISLTEQCLVAAGRAICDLVLFDSSNGIISTVTFYMMIEASPNAEKLIESDSAFRTLMDVLEEARGLDIHIDDELSETSTHGLQNRVITQNLTNLSERIAELEKSSSCSVFVVGESKYPEIESALNDGQIIVLDDPTTKLRYYYESRSSTSYEKTITFFTLSSSSILHIYCVYRRSGFEYETFWDNIEFSITENLKEYIDGKTITDSEIREYLQIEE